MVRKTGELHFFHKWIPFCLLYVPYLLFIILISLCYFCGPSAEDLSINYYSSQTGPLEFIHEFYLKAGSRYFSFSIVTLICHSRFMLEHYWIVLSLLFILLWLVLRLLVKTIVGFMDITIPAVWVSWISMILLLSLCSVVFEMSSFLYWISGSITYLPAFILFTFLLLVLLKSISEKQRTGYYFSAVLLVFLITGANEIGLYFLIIFLLWTSSLYYSVKRKINILLLVCLLAVFLSLIFFILPSGVSRRAGNYRTNFPVFHALLISFGYTARIFIRAISSPLAWITMVLALLAGLYTKTRIKNRLAGRMVLDPKLITSITILSVMFFFFVIYLFSGELLAPRAQNLIMVFSFSGILLSCYSGGLSLDPRYATFGKFYRGTLLQFLVLLMMTGSSFVHETIYNSLTGFIYNRVIKQRNDTIQSARRNGLQMVTLNPYSEDFAEESKKILPPFLHTIIKKKIINYDDWMHFQDPLQDTALYIHYFAEFHHIDTIRYLGVDYERIGLSKTDQK